MRLRFILFLSIQAFVLTAAAHAEDPPWIARSRTGMVASDSPEASQIGAAVLKAGGNAFDAAVATSFALTVARPQSTGLGGGGFMIAYVANEKRFIALDFRETAPASATPERYAKLFAERGDGPSPSVYGGNAVAVPGQLAGLAEINRRFGTQPLSELVEYARELARAGFRVDRHFLAACEHAHNAATTWPQFRSFTRQLGSDGDRTAPQLGKHWKMHSGLNRALTLIAEGGPQAFYGGPIGEAIVKAVNAAGGAMTMNDLRNYRVKEREPLRFSVYDPFTKTQYELVTMPPPSSGGICLAEILNIRQATLDRSDLHPERAAPHIIVEAMKHAFADRARWLGDPDFADIPAQRLISPKYAADLARRIATHKTLAPTDYGSAAPPPDDGGTSHFCVADKHGNLVALTETINGTFGALVVAEPYGIILNNEMDDFLTVRGQANMFGLVQSTANLVAPGKRPLSSMSPTIILQNEKPFLALGAAGGPRIISSVLNVALEVMEGQPLAEAMSAPRLHHQWQPDIVYFDDEPPSDMAERLTSFGHQLSNQRKTGVVQAIQFLEDGTMIGASDPRKGGRPAGLSVSAPASRQIHANLFPDRLCRSLPAERRRTHKCLNQDLWPTGDRTTVR